MHAETFIAVPKNLQNMIYETMRMRAVAKILRA